MTAQEILIQKYGNPFLNKAAFEAKWTTVWNCQNEFPSLPFKRIYCHKNLVPHLQKAFKALLAKNLLREIKTFDGCFLPRYIRGYEAKKILSIHTWAAAVDFNAAENALGAPVTFSKEFLQVWRDCGFRCGADFKRLDGMHFEKTDI